jgi:hypothetical protein
LDEYVTRLGGRPGSSRRGSRGKANGGVAVSVVGVEVLRIRLKALIIMRLG